MIPEGNFFELQFIADQTMEENPTDDLTSALLAPEIDGDRLTDDEITGFLFLMVVAGNETTTKLLANAWYWAWRNPDERAKPFSDASYIPIWVEETLRYDTSSQMLARITTTDVEMYDRVIPAGDRVVLLAGSANRDPRVFSHPDRYDLHRKEGPHLAFSTGAHVCLGVWLGRSTVRVAATN